MLPPLGCNNAQILDQKNNLGGEESLRHQPYYPMSLETEGRANSYFFISCFVGLRDFVWVNQAV